MFVEVSSFRLNELYVNKPVTNYFDVNIFSQIIHGNYLNEI